MLGHVKSGKEVADYIISITPDEAYIPDYYLEKYVINNNWVLKRIAITEIFKDAVVVQNFEEFEKQLEQDPNYLYRYGQDEVVADELFLPVVFYDDGSKTILIDGFSRTRMHFDLGKKTILAYVLASQ